MTSIACVLHHKRYRSWTKVQDVEVEPKCKVTVLLHLLKLPCILGNYSAFVSLEWHCTFFVIICQQYSQDGTNIITSNLWKEERKIILRFTNSHCFFQKLMFCFDSLNYRTITHCGFFVFPLFFLHNFLQVVFHGGPLTTSAESRKKITSLH